MGTDILVTQMPTRDAHKQFQKWAQEYGPIYSLILGTKTLIVLSSDVAVKDLLDKRSGIYSDRQDMYIGSTLCSEGLRMLMMVSGMILSDNSIANPDCLALRTKMAKCNTSL